MMLEEELDGEDDHRKVGEGRRNWPTMDSLPREAAVQITRCLTLAELSA